MLEQNLFCIWLMVAIPISVEGSNPTNTDSTTSSDIMNTTTTTTNPNKAEAGICEGNSTILCSVCRFLTDLDNPYLVFGIGIGGLVVLIASAVIIAVCCDRRLRKRKQPASDHPTEANKEATSSESPVNRASEHPYYNESATAAINHLSEQKDAMPPYSTVYELARQVPGESLNSADASESCPYAEVTRDQQKLRPNHSNPADYCTEYADTASVQRNVMRLPATGGYEEEEVGPNCADSDGAMQWEENDPYEGALPVDAGALEQRGTGGRGGGGRGGGGEAILMQNCRLPPLEVDTTLIDNFIYSNAAVMQRF